MSQQHAKLARHASTIIELTDQADVSLHAENEGVISRWCDAIVGLKQALLCINASGQAKPNWRTDPSRTRYREDYETRLRIYILRNKRRKKTISHNDAAAVLEELGFDDSKILRLLGDLITADEAPPAYRGLFMAGD